MGFAAFRGDAIRLSACLTILTVGGEQFALGVSVATDNSQFHAQVHPGDGHEYMLRIECGGQDLRCFGKVPRGFFMAGLSTQCAA